MNSWTGPDVQGEVHSITEILLHGHWKSYFPVENLKALLDNSTVIQVMI